MVIIGQRSSEILIRKDKKDIQTQERQKKQEKNWLTKHESYILVRDAWAGLFIVYSSLCFCICLFLFQQVRSPPSIFFCDSLFHLIPPLTLSAAFPTFADSLQVLQKKVDICLAPFNWRLAPLYQAGQLLSNILFVEGSVFDWHKMSTVYSLFWYIFVSDFVWQEGEGESTLKITSLLWVNEKDYWRWFNYNPSSFWCCCFNSISFLSHI